MSHLPKDSESLSRLVAALVKVCQEALDAELARAKAKPKKKTKRTPS